MTHWADGVLHRQAASGAVGLGALMTSFRRIALAVLAGVLLMAGLGFLLWPRFEAPQVDYKMPGNPGPKIAAAQAAAIERRERLIDQTIWKKEIEAQQYGRVFEDFWDGVNAATNKWALVEDLKFEGIVFPELGEKERLGHGIERWKRKEKLESPHVDSYEGWLGRVRGWREAGWQIMQCEFRHNAFDPQTNDVPAKSKFYFSVHLTNAMPARAVVEGDLTVEWERRQGSETPRISRIDASGLQVMFRAGPRAFVPVLSEAFDAPDLSSYIEPLNVYDLDGDGLLEIILPGLNRVFRRGAAGYEVAGLYPEQRLQILNGLFADFDGDGVTDFLYIAHEGVFLMKGSAEREFQIKPRRACPPLDVFEEPRTLSCGDIDGDGDLDLFIGQYKGPFVNGTIPTPYFDANDGYPSYLLLNDGKGNFSDSTEASGLAAKRFRRVFAASFVDLNQDGNLDLVVTSDFAGADVYRGDGRGRFTEVTADVLKEPHAFGMAHTFADFNNDRRLDFLMAGMTSATVDRLERLGLNRPSSKLDPAMRAKMTYGSRLYLGTDHDNFVSPYFAETIARTGWTWGVSAVDFDNDGWVDVYAGNGLETGKTVRDYESEFWLHDVFVGDAKRDSGRNAYFVVKGGATRGRGMSYGGLEKNRLFLNRAGGEFVNVAHLFGVASEEDCRNVVAADFNGDGKVDIAFTTIEVWPPYKQRLHLFENKLEQTGNWIGVRFRDEPGHVSPIGARVTVRVGSSERVQSLVTGDSFRSQHPPNIRFGIAQFGEAEWMEINWPGGGVTRIAEPEKNQWYDVRSPKR